MVEWSAGQLEEVMDDAVALVSDALGLTSEGPEQDVMEMVVRASSVLMEDPKATFADVIEARYPDQTVEEIRGWWGGWA